MNILLYDIVGSYMQDDLLISLKEMGHNYKSILYNIQERYYDAGLEAHMEKELRENHYDIVLTTNFYPMVAKICYKNNIIYKSWCYDAPLNLPNEESFDLPTNQIYTFDRGEVIRYRKMGLDTVYHLPLAVNIERLNKIKPDYEKYGADIALIGKLYESTLSDLKRNMNDYDRGQVEGIVEAQHKVIGNYIIYDLITDELVESICKTYREKDPNAVQPTKRQLAYSITTYVTQLDRIQLLRMAARLGETNLYTYKITEGLIPLLEGVKIKEPVEYLTTMPSIFKSTKINLCPTIRNISTGIPLRSLDILACGAFLLSNFQPELAEWFEDGKEVAMYSSMEEAYDKMKYYLAHDSEREKIAAAGYEIVKEEFNYKKQLSILLSDPKEYY